MITKSFSSETSPIKRPRLPNIKTNTGDFQHDSYKHRKIFKLEKKLISK